MIIMMVTTMITDPCGDIQEDNTEDGWWLVASGWLAGDDETMKRVRQGPTRTLWTHYILCPCKRVMKLRQHGSGFDLQILALNSDSSHHRVGVNN